MTGRLIVPQFNSFPLPASSMKRPGRTYEPWCAINATRASSALGYTAATAATFVLIGMAVMLGIVPQTMVRSFTLTLSSLFYRGPGSSWKYVLIALTFVSSVCTVAMIALLDRPNWVTPLLGSLATVALMLALGLLLLPLNKAGQGVGNAKGVFGDVGAGHLVLVALVTLLWPTMFFIAISRTSFMRGWRAPLVLNLIFLIAIPGIVAASSLLQWALHKSQSRWRSDATEDIAVRSSLRSSAEMLYMAFLTSTLLFLAGMPRCRYADLTSPVPAPLFGTTQERARAESRQ